MPQKSESDIYHAEFRPRPAVETRRGPNGYTYHAEVIFNGHNYIMPKEPFTTREEALACASEFVQDMIAEMLSTGKACVGAFKIAKE